MVNAHKILDTAFQALLGTISLPVVVEEEEGELDGQQWEGTCGSDGADESQEEERRLPGTSHGG
jgi:hypothetical protein